jgi:hypothetical protein
MKHAFVCIFLLHSITALSQQITCKVADASTGAPLPYATIIFKKANQILYADSSGEFSFLKDAALSKDSIIAEYLSYASLTLPANSIADGFIINLQPQLNLLQNVTVTACNSWETITVNKIRGKAKDYIGPGPEIRIIIITRFTNAENLTGFINEIECYSGNFTEKAQVPLRIHWYKWNNTMNMPGEEISNTNIIVHPYQTGWNKFSVPPKTIYYSNDGVVLGLEFIYPVEYKKQYASFTNDKQKLDWLNDMNHRWSLGMQTTSNPNDGVFFIMNNEPVAAYNKKSDDRYLKPAMRIAIETCKQ